MNHYKQLAAFIHLTQSNTKLFPTHISLYTVLFHLWSRNRFQNPVGIIREDVMKMSKINAKATYHKCMRDLHELKFISYHPSYSQYHSSTVHLIALNDEPVQLMTTSSFNEPLSPVTSSKNEQVKNDAYIYNNSTTNNKDIFMDVPVQSMNTSHKKAASKKNQTRRQKFIIPTIDQVKHYFEESKSTKEEANRFYNYYSANGWVVGGGKTPMKDWHAAARNWILNSPNFRGKNTNSTGPGNLHVYNDKNYAEPL